MMEIRLLDETTIDKIAAGEVVDRPASVVKELVENAMDCGADAITVEIRDGGISLIRVTDNGAGIDKSQVPNAFVRHATSKIQSVEDLLHLSSLGFRGEALSSICAVAQVEMVTKVPGDLTGARYVIEGGAEKEREEIGAPDGTTVIVRNLFYNVPARKKFLKTPQGEGGHISDLMERLALSRPHISVKYVVNGQVKFYTSGNGDLNEIIYRIYGRDIADGLVRLEKEEGGRRLAGYIGTPAIGRANRNFETYFINGRFVKSALMAKAAEEAYKPYLMQHKYPFFVLHLSIAPDELDVNVHPSKMEVRFHEQRAVSDFLYGAVRDTLAGKEMLKEVTFSEHTERKEPPAGQRAIPEPFETEARRRMERIEQAKRRETVNAYRDAGPSFFEAEGVEETPQTPTALAEEPVYHARPVSHEAAQLNLFEERLLSPRFQDEYDILGQIFSTYWIVAFHDKLLIIDQHAAHEKVKYERLCRQIRERDVISQQMNPPAVLTFSGREEAVYREYEGDFRKLGFEIEPFGGSEYAVRSVPAELFGRSAEALLRDVLDELADGPLRGEPEPIAGRLASLSCKAAVKGNHAMSRAEAEALIKELLTLDNPYHCPHGRPTVITMSKQELEKRFSRIV